MKKTITLTKRQIRLINLVILGIIPMLIGIGVFAFSVYTFFKIAEGTTRITTITPVDYLHAQQLVSIAYTIYAICDMILLAVNQKVLQQCN